MDIILKNWFRRNTVTHFRKCDSTPLKSIFILGNATALSFSLCSTIGESSLSCDVKISRRERKKERKKKKKRKCRARMHHAWISLSVFDICIPTPQCTFPPDCRRCSARTRPRSLVRTLHFQAGATSSPLLSSLVPSVSLSLSYSHCLPPPNRQPLLFSHSSFFLYPIICLFLCLFLLLSLCLSLSGCLFSCDDERGLLTHLCSHLRDLLTFLRELWYVSECRSRIQDHNWWYTRF